MAVRISERIKSRVNLCSAERNALGGVSIIFAYAPVERIIKFGIRIIRLFMILVDRQNAALVLAVRPFYVRCLFELGIAVGICEGIIMLCRRRVILASGKLVPRLAVL